jgi:hypothetical protein
MSEATGRAEMERRLIEKSVEDEDFRRRLIEDPKAAVRRSGSIGCVAPHIRPPSGKALRPLAQEYAALVAWLADSA